MLGHFGATVAMALLAASTASAETPTETVKAEACLRANVARVVAMDQDIESAAGFLVNYICGAEVEAASRFQRNTELVAVLERGVPGAASKVSVDPVDGRLRAPAEPGKSPTDGLGAVNVLQAGFTPSPSPQLKSLAAELIMKARTGIEIRR